MSVFCFFLVPAFYLWRRSAFPQERSTLLAPGPVSGFTLGLIAGYLRFSAGEVFVSRDFGLMSYAAQLVDGAPLDSLLPLVGYALIRRFSRPRRPFSESEAVTFSLAWLMPLCAFRSIYWSAVPDPVRLMVLPVLAVLLAVSMPYWIGRIRDEFGFSQVVAVAATVGFPLATAAVTWAFYSHRMVLGVFFFCISVAASFPAILPTRSSR